MASFTLAGPDVAHLTGFYLWMSFGGALGGIFAALVAPHLFATVAEYPILIVAALIARPHLLDAPSQRGNAKPRRFWSLA